MSFNIGAVGAGAAAQTQAAAATSANQASQASEAASSVETDDAVSVEVNIEAITIPDSPPPEVHHAIAVASQSYQKLQGSGRQLSFSLDSGSGALTVKLKDLSGNHISSLSVSDALRIAAGGTYNR